MGRETPSPPCCGVRVAFDMRLGFEEAAALRWALEKMGTLTRRVVDVPDVHRDVIAAAIGKAVERLEAAEAWAESELRGGRGGEGPHV